MSKAEEKAWEWSVKNKLDPYSMGRAYGEGYYQAEKDLALTIDDIERIHTFLYAIKHNKQGVFTFTRLSDEQYQEVLKRFRDYKERENK